jgi:hypothetical protein
MFPPPIRPIQSSEVRRVDEVTSRKSVVERVPSPLTQTDDGVRVTIGAAARRLAGGRDQPSAAPSSEESERTSQAGFGEAELSGASSVDGAAFRQVFAAATGERRGAVTPAGESDDTEANSFANRALRAFSSGETTPTTSSAAGEEDGELQWSAEDSAKVPFEVLQRAVTQATAQGEPEESDGDMVAYSPNEPVFSAPENGGEPFGREIPFEFGPSGDEGAKPPSMPLSRDEVDEVVSELTWSLPATEATEGTGVFVP